MSKHDMTTLQGRGAYAREAAFRGVRVDYTDTSITVGPATGLNWTALLVFAVTLGTILSAAAHGAWNRARFTA